ncbi:MAG: hypothetical protein ACRCXL_03940 [Dermatophilaceae bacterium]
MTAAPRRVGAALDLWAVRLLIGTGEWMQVRIFRWLVALVLVVLGPIAAATSMAVLDLTTTLLSGESLGGVEHRRIALGLAAAATLAFGYLALADVVRTHLSSAALTIAASPMRGLWLAADIGLWRVVLAERGAVLTARAIAQGGALGGAALHVARSGHPAWGDLALTAVMMPLAQLAAGAAMAATHACRRERPRVGTRVVALLVLFNTLAGFGAASMVNSEDLGATGRDAATAFEAIGRLGEYSGWIRLGSCVVLILTLAWLTVVVATRRTFSPLTTGHRQEARASRPARSLPRYLFRASGGVTQRHVPRQIIATACLLAAAALGWRAGGGPVLDHVPTVARALVFAGVAAGMGVAAGTLIVSGQSVRLWHYRQLWEAGCSPQVLWAGAVAPAAAAGAIVASAVTVGVWGLTGRVESAPALVLLATVASECHADTVFATAQAGESARTTNSLLAIAGYILAIPTLLVGAASGGWVPWAIAGLLVIHAGGGFLWFVRRLHSMPIGAVQ